MSLNVIIITHQYTYRVLAIGLIAHHAKMSLPTFYYYSYHQEHMYSCYHTVVQLVIIIL